MKILSLFFLSTILLTGEEWISLFDGKTLNGWSCKKDINWTVEDEAIRANSGPVGLLLSEKKYENYELKLEFKAALGCNSGVFLNTPEKIKNIATDCYEVNIADPTNPFPTGSIVKRIKIEGIEEKDEWRSFHLIVNQGTVSLTLDGKKLYEYLSKPCPAGFVGLQKNKGNIAFRKIFIKEL